MKMSVDTNNTDLQPQGQYNLMDKFIVRTPHGEVEATILRLPDEDGRMLVLVDYPNGERLEYLSAEELDAMRVQKPQQEKTTAKPSRQNENNGKEEKVNKKEKKEPVPKQDTFRSSVLDTLWGCGGWILIIAIFVAPIILIDRCKENNKQSEQKREMYVTQMDSIHSAIRDSIRKNSPAYLDSVRQAKEEFEKWKEEYEKRERHDYQYRIIGFWHVGDSIYHEHFSCYFYKEDIGSLRFITQETADMHNLKECDDCYNDWENLE